MKDVGGRGGDTLGVSIVREVDVRERPIGYERTRDDDVPPTCDTRNPRAPSPIIPTSHRDDLPPPPLPPPPKVPPPPSILLLPLPLLNSPPLLTSEVLMNLLKLSLLICDVVVTLVTCLLLNTTRTELFAVMTANRSMSLLKFVK